MLSRRWWYSQQGAGTPFEDDFDLEEDVSRFFFVGRRLDADPPNGVSRFFVFPWLLDEEVLDEEVLEEELLDEELLDEELLDGAPIHRMSIEGAMVVG